MGKDIKYEIFFNLFESSSKFWESNTTNTTTSDKVKIEYTFKPSPKEF
jgi:hypothetical protein